MKFRPGRYAAVAAAKASFSTSTAYRFGKDHDYRRRRRRRGRRRPDPLAGIFRGGSRVDVEGRSPVFGPSPFSKKMSDAIPNSGLGSRALERQIRAWRAIHGRSRRSSSGGSTGGRIGLSDFTDMGDVSITDREGRRSSTGSIIPGSPIPASSTPRRARR